jgi:hypothetical protein
MYGIKIYAVERWSYVALSIIEGDFNFCEINEIIDFEES